MELTIPPGCIALLELPENVSEYTIDGKPYDKTSSHEIISGRHKITYEL